MKKKCSINSLEGSRRTPLDHPSRCPPPRLETSPTVICVSSFSTRQSLEQKSSPKKRRSWVLKVLEHGSKTYRLHNMHMCVCVCESCQSNKKSSPQKRLAEKKWNENIWYSNYFCRIWIQFGFHRFNLCFFCATLLLFISLGRASYFFGNICCFW